MPESIWSWEFAQENFFQGHESLSSTPNVEISDRQISDAVSPFSIAPTEDQIRMIREYSSLLLKWNRSVSLTAITDLVEIVGRHFGESMYASRFLPLENCRLVDIGTGAGFPGLALKIICPEIELILIESNRKKCAFLNEVVRTLGFASIEIRAERFEQIRPESIQGNIITSRAVGEFKQLIRWSKNALARRGHLMLWVGSDDSTRIANTPGWVWQPGVHIPDSQRRFLLIGRPIDDLRPVK